MALFSDMQLWGGSVSKWGNFVKDGCLLCIGKMRKTRRNVVPQKSPTSIITEEASKTPEYWTKRNIGILDATKREPS
jgi:hypothetical protein